MRAHAHPPTRHCSSTPAGGSPAPPCTLPALPAPHAPASRLKGAMANEAAVSTMSRRIRRLRPASSSMLMYSCG